MLAEVEAGKIGTIIVKDMSRFCRNYLEVGFYTEILFPKKQIRFIAINNSVDSDKPQDNDFTPFLNIMNGWYAKDTSNKISRARSGGKKADTVTAKLKDDSKSPQTGDTSNLALWLALLFVSGGAAIGTTIVSRKKKYNK